MDVLAVDGGQSAIRLRHSAIGDGVEVDGVSRQAGDIVTAVDDSIGAGWRQLGSPKVNRAMLGLSTAPSDPDSANRLCVMVSDGTGASEVWLADDAVTSGVGALSGQSGVSLTVGTGVACLAIPVAGDPSILGGYGYLLGDEGGGFWMGRRGLSAVLRAAEGRGPHTRLTALAEARYGGLDDLHVRIHDAPRAVDRIARFAPDVVDTAAGGDAVASQIVDEAVLELANLAEVGAKHVGQASVDVALGGRLLAGANELRNRLERVVGTQVRGACVRSADGSALDGAMALGRQSNAGRYASLVHVWPQQTSA